MAAEQTCLKECIQFVNDLTKNFKSSKDLRKFYEIVKSRQRNDMDDDEFYDSAYHLVNGDFNLMKKLGNALKDEMTPSYIRLPRNTRAADNHVLNNSCSIYSNKICERDAKCVSDYIYQPLKVIRESKSMPSVDKMSSNSKRQKREAVLWWESRMSELDLVLNMVKVCKRMMKRALEMIESNEWPENVKVMDYLLKNGVKIKLLKNIFSGFDLEVLMLLPHMSLPLFVTGLRHEKMSVVNAIEKLVHWRREKQF